MAQPLGALPDPAAWARRRVFMTGRTGFKGSWLQAWLRRMGAEVTGFSLPPDAGSLGEALGCRAGELGDIRDPAALRAAMQAAAPSVVLHLAAQALVRRSYAEPLETFAINVMGTAHVLEAVRATPSVRAVLVVTSDKCYENREWDWPYRESEALGGHDPYSASKAGAELVAASWRRSFLADAGVGVATARAGNVVGGGDGSQDRLVPDCVRAFAAGRTVRLRHPRATRPWQHVLDPLCGYLLLAERLLAGDGMAEAWAEAWNFGPGPDDVRPVAEVVAMLAEAWGGGAGWAAEAGDQPHEAGLLAVDAAKARARLGWRPRLPLPAGLRMTVRWHQRHLAGADPRQLIDGDIATYLEGAEA